MSGETEKQVSGWTVDTLKEHFSQRFTDSDKAIQAALLAAKEAVLKAENATEKRFEATNEFRGQLADQTATLLPRSEYDSNHKALEDKIDALTDRMNRNDGKSSGLSAGWGYLVGAIVLAATIISVILALND